GALRRRARDESPHRCASAPGAHVSRSRPDAVDPRWRRRRRAGTRTPDASAFHRRANRTGRCDGRGRRPRRRCLRLSRRSDNPDVLRFLALPTGCNVELDPLALVEGAIPVTLDRGIVHEDVVPPLDGDEAVAFLAVEPLDRSGRCHVLLCSLPCPTDVSVGGGCSREGQWRCCESIRDRHGARRSHRCVALVSLPPRPKLTRRLYL